MTDEALEDLSQRAGDPDARFSLANERTFLAWGRTCLAMVATGLLVARVLAEGEDRALLAAGLGLIVVGAALAGWSYRIYRRNDEAIRSQTPLARSSLPLVLLVVIFLASLAAIGLSFSR